MKQLAAIALKQLEAWELLAAGWVMIPEYRGDTLQLHLVCPKDHSSVYAVSEQAISPSVLLAATVAHLRVWHQDLEPDDGIQGISQVDDNSRSALVEHLPGAAYHRPANQE